MIDSRISLINVATPDGDKDYVALISPELAFSIGLFPEAILGVLKRPLSPGDGIAWDNFIPNAVFASFVASSLQHTARRIRSCGKRRNKSARAVSSLLTAARRRRKAPFLRKISSGS